MYSDVTLRYKVEKEIKTFQFLKIRTVELAYMYTCLNVYLPKCM